MRNKSRGIQGRAAAAHSGIPGVLDLTSREAAVPVRDLDEARHLYLEVLGCSGGHGDGERVHFTLVEYPIVCHLRSQSVAQHRMALSDTVMATEAAGDPRLRVMLEGCEWQALAKRLRHYRAEFNVAPCIRLSGARFGEATLCLVDPSGNGLEFRSSHHLAGRPSHRDRKRTRAMLSIALAITLVWGWILVLTKNRPEVTDAENLTPSAAVARCASIESCIR